MIESKSVELVSSSVLEYENSRNPFPLKQQAMQKYLQMAIVKQQADETIKQRAKQFEQEGLKAIDALHVSCAEASGIDYFITSDKRLINRCQKLNF
jgi:predicted nucleic acid-binding protein